MTSKNSDSWSLITIIVCIILLANVFTIYAISSYRGGNQAQDPEGNVSGYQMTGHSVDERFKRVSREVSVQDAGTSTEFRYSQDGLHFSFHSDDDVLVVKRGFEADTLIIDLDTSQLMEHFYGQLVFELKFKVGHDSYYVVEMTMSRMNTTLNYTYLSNGLTLSSYGDLLYDVTDEISLLVHVMNGRIAVGLNGIEHEGIVPSLEHWSPEMESVKIMPRNKYSCDQVGILRSLQVGPYSRVVFVDGLHKTIVPDGKDFAFSLHLHADRTYPGQIYQMANLSEQYGLEGTYDAWVYGSPLVYGLDDPSYASSLHVLQSSGWDIGVHALSYNRDLTTEQSREALDIFTEEFGPPKTWSDHGARQQDLCQNGSSPDSPYYVGDIVNEIGAAWWNDRQHSHSSYNDLNIEGMSYRLEGAEDLPLFRVSQMQSRLLYFEPGRENDIDQYLRAWSVERSVYVSHDYFPYFFYVTNATGNYSIFPEHDGISNTPWAHLNPKLVFVEDDWNVLPRFRNFLNWTEGYDVWFAPVREIYDRSSIVQQISVLEDEDQVIIRNPTDTALKGLTLFSKARPLYHLEGNIDHYPQKGTGSSWHFVFDLDPNATMVLKKVKATVPYDLSFGQTFGGDISLTAWSPHCMMRRR